MRTVIVVCAVLLAIGAALVVRRLELGPSILDRVVALDLFVSTMLAGLALYAAWNDRLDLVAVMVVLSLVGFVGAVSVARFVAAESEEERRILTPEELRRPSRRSAAAAARSSESAASAGSASGASADPDEEEP